MRHREVEREGKKGLGNIQRAMLMLRSSAGAITSIFVRAVGIVATFPLLLSSPAQSVPTVRLMVG